MRSPEDSPGLTPIDDLFTYHIFGVPQQIAQWREDIGSYTIGITGLVDVPLQLPLSQVRSDFQPAAEDMVLQCMTNVHWGRIRFTGARLSEVLEYAGVAEAATKVVLRGADGYDTDLRIDEIRDRPNAFLLAYEMNDELLRPEHGFPLRVTADGKYGYKWCKWLTQIELVDHDYKGHYEGKRGWSDDATRGQPVA